MSSSLIGAALGRVEGLSAGERARLGGEWEQTEGVDGYVSLEVPPTVAYDGAATVALARRLHDQAGFPQPADQPQHAAGPDRHGS